MLQLIKEPQGQYFSKTLTGNLGKYLSLQVRVDLGVIVTQIRLTTGYSFVLYPGRITLHESESDIKGWKEVIFRVRLPTGRLQIVQILTW